MTGLSNSLGYLTESFTYDAFGNMLGVRAEIPGANNSDGRYRFSTKELNARSGLVYFGARYYDPRVGRFITPDPLTWGPDDPRIIFISRTILTMGKMAPTLLHQYIYVGNNPSNKIDPLGLSEKTAFWNAIRSYQESVNSALYAASSSINRTAEEAAQFIQRVWEAHQAFHNSIRDIWRSGKANTGFGYEYMAALEILSLGSLLATAGGTVIAEGTMVSIFAGGFWIIIGAEIIWIGIDVFQGIATP